MITESIAELSKYEEIAPVNERRGVFLVRNKDTGQICVKKIQKIYNKDVYTRVNAQRIKGIPEIFHVSENDGTLTVIEECVSGETVESMLKRRGALSFVEVQSVAIKLCEIVERIHGMGPPVIHRDIKPSNVMITSSGEVYLLDLNAAKLEKSDETEDTVLLGTHGYAAPKQYGFGSS